MLAVFDIGGSRIKAALSPAPGVVEPMGAVATPAADFDEFARELAGFLAAGQPGRVAIAIAGCVDPDSGRIKCANIPCIDGRTIAADLGRALGRPVTVVNDADAFALAEAGHGAGRGHRNILGIILGTGVGGGLVIDGRIVTGAGGFAGEWGHGPVLNRLPLGRDVPHFACGCGQSGCVDTIGGARGLERLHGHLHGVTLDAPSVVAAWQAGDALASDTISVWLDLVAGPLAMVLNTVGSSIVPVGGGLARSVKLVGALDAAVRARVLRRTEAPILVPAALRVEPGLVGASLAGWQAHG